MFCVFLLDNQPEIDCTNQRNILLQYMAIINEGLDLSTNSTGKVCHKLIGYCRLGVHMGIKFCQAVDSLRNGVSNTREQYKRFHGSKESRKADSHKF